MAAPVPETAPAAEPPVSAAPAAPRRAPVRSQPAQVYRAGDKSELKRLLMQKKKQTKS
jgi:chemotaxis protein methyltransferase CheR